MIKREATKKLSRIRTMLIYSHMVAYTDDSLDDEEFLILVDINIGILIDFVSIHLSISTFSSRTGFLKYSMSGN